MEDVMENDDGEVSRIKPIQYYVKYSFIPSTDGCFYDIGFFDILLPVNKVVNTTLICSWTQAPWRMLVAGS
jgi:hypothetical protein